MEPIRKVRIYEIVADRIKALLTSGEYKVGDILPAEREFAQNFGVSRSAVREAMIVLQRLDMVDNSPGKGTVVKRVTPPTVNEHLFELLQKEEKSIMKILELRKGIEIEAASLAAQRCTPRDVRNLTEKFSFMKAGVERGEIAAKEDHDFHIALVKMTKNDFYVSVMTAISDVFYSSLQKTRAETLTRPGGPLVVLCEHEAILTAVKNRSEREARRAMRHHLDSVMEKLEKLLGSRSIGKAHKQE